MSFAKRFTRCHGSSPSASPTRSGGLTAYLQRSPGTFSPEYMSDEEFQEKHEQWMKECHEEYEAWQRGET